MSTYPFTILSRHTIAPLNNGTKLQNWIIQTDSKVMVNSPLAGAVHEYQSVRIPVALGSPTSVVAVWLLLAACTKVPVKTWRLAKLSGMAKAHAG